MTGRKSKGKSKSPGNVEDGPAPFRMELGERLRWLLDLFATRVEAGAVADISPEHLPAYIAGRVRPRFEAIARLAAAKQVSLEWLASGEGPRFCADAEPDGFVEIAMQADADTRYGEDDAAPIVFSRAAVQKLVKTSADKLRFVVHRGNANEPAIKDGDFLLVDTSVERLADDGLYVFVRDAKYQAKFVETLLNGRVALRSRNPNYDTQTLTKDEAEQLRPFGRVCWRGGAI